MGVPLNHPFNRNFHYKQSIWATPILGNPIKITPTSDPNQRSSAAAAATGPLWDAFANPGLNP